MKIEKRHGSTLRLQPLLRLWLCAVCLAAGLHLAAGAARAEEPERSTYSRAEINWAVTWINNALPHFLQKGIIDHISTKDDGFQVFAGRLWYELSITQQGEFLKNLARAREIIGHPPQFAVRDAESSATVARVSWSGIEILVPGEGFRYYQPAADDEAASATTTVY